jgi:hypothetical protein
MDKDKKGTPILHKHLFSFVVLFFSVFGFVCLLLNFEAGWAHGDASEYHIPYIQKIINEGLLSALESPSAAMPPLFHLVASLTVLATGLDTYFAAQLTSFFGALVTLVSLNLYLKRELHGSIRASIFLTLIFCLSWPFLSSSISPVTDAFGLCLLVLAFICVAQNRLLPLCALLPLLILTRQYYVVVSIALLLTPLVIRLTTPAEFRPNLFLVFVYLLSGFLGLLTLAALVGIWGGFVPLLFRSMYTNETAFNFGALSLSLSYLGMLCFILIGLQLTKPSKKGVLIGFLIAIFSAFLLPTNFDLNEGRWGSIFWTLSKVFYVYDINLLFILLHTACFSVIVTFFSEPRSKELNFKSVFFALNGMGFVAIFCLQPFAWQRYIDPMLGLALFFWLHQSGRLRSR